MRLLFTTIALSVSLLGSLDAQAPAFDVASVKLTPPLTGSPHVRIGPQPGNRWIATQSTVADLLRSLYPKNSFLGHDFGGPPWTDRTRFNVSAVAAGNVSRDMLNDMARELLRERFGLALSHRTAPGRHLRNRAGVTDQGARTRLDGGRR
jgi:uncharacterized protein (TIGR03435 family)